MMDTITISTSQGVCTVKLGTGILHELPLWVSEKKVFLLADARLEKEAIGLKNHFFQIGKQCVLSTMNIQESSKSFENIYPLYSQMLLAGMDRESILIAMGGGVTLDIGGFLAGTFLRGIPWVGIPTTLLAQVDSSIGGKTGINHASGKNLIGVFHSPKLVCCDIELASTLPQREIISGLGEIIKYGLIGSPSFFTWISDHISDFFSLQENVLVQAVATCLSMKGKLIEQDERDQLGIREQLNFGHTFGHALEAATDYSYFRHGEAVLWGMEAEAHLSVQKQRLPIEVFEKISLFLRKIPRPPIPKPLSFETLLSFIKKDKKQTEGHPRFVLLKEIGKTIPCDNVSYEEMRTTFNEIRNYEVGEIFESTRK